MLLTQSPSSLYLFFSPFFYPFLYFSLLFSFGYISDKPKLYFLSTALYCHIDIRRHTRRLFLHFLFYFWIDLRVKSIILWLPLFSISVSMFVGKRVDHDCLFLWLNWSLFDDALVRSFPVGTRDGRVCPSRTIQVGWSVPLFSCTVKLFLYYHHIKLQGVKSLSHLYHKIALVLFSCCTLALLLYHSLWTMGMINLLNIDVVYT